MSMEEARLRDRVSPIGILNDRGSSTKQELELENFDICMIHMNSGRNR